MAPPAPEFACYRPAVPLERKSLLLAALMGRVAENEDEEARVQDGEEQLRDAFMAGSWMDS